MDLSVPMFEVSRLPSSLYVEHEMTSVKMLMNWPKIWHTHTKKNQSRWNFLCSLVHGLRVDWCKGQSVSQFSHSVVSKSLWPMDCRRTGFPVHHQHPEFTQTHVHWVSDAISSSVISFSSCLQSFQHQGLLWVSSSHQVAKVLEFQLQHQSFQWIFRTDFLSDGLVGSPQAFNIRGLIDVWWIKLCLVVL